MFKGYTIPKNGYNTRKHSGWVIDPGKSSPCTVVNLNQHPRHCSRNFGHLYGWTRNMNNAGQRMQASSAIGYGGTLFRKKLWQLSDTSNQKVIL